MRPSAAPEILAADSKREMAVNQMIQSRIMGGSIRVFARNLQVLFEHCGYYSNLRAALQRVKWNDIKPVWIRIYTLCLFK